MTVERGLENIDRDAFGTRKQFTDNDLEDDKALTQHAYLPILSKKGTKTRFYHHGYGENDADKAVGRLGLDLQVADDAAGTGAVAAVGTARAAVYPDESFDVPKATGDEIRLKELRDLNALNMRDRELFPTKKPGAMADEYIVWEVEVDPSQDGMVVYAEGSDGILHYTERKISRT